MRADTRGRRPPAQVVGSPWGLLARKGEQHQQCDHRCNTGWALMGYWSMRGSLRPFASQLLARNANNLGRKRREYRTTRSRATRTAVRGDRQAHILMCPQWDSNPHCADFKSAASANWAMGASG